MQIGNSEFDHMYMHSFNIQQVRNAHSDLPWIEDVFRTDISAIDGEFRIQLAVLSVSENSKLS